MHEMSLEKQGSEGSLKCKLSEGSPNQIIYINRQSGPVDIYRRVVHKQLIYISIVGAAQLIYIHWRVAH